MRVLILFLNKEENKKEISIMKKLDIYKEEK